MFHNTNQAGLETRGWRARGFKPEDLGTHITPADTKGSFPSNATPACAAVSAPSLAHCIALPVASTTPSLFF